MVLCVLLWAINHLKLQTDCAFFHFCCRHFCQRRINLRSKNISQIEQIFVLKGHDRCLDAREPLGSVSALLSSPLITYL